MPCSSAELLQFPEICDLVDWNPLSNVSVTKARLILAEFKNTRRNLDSFSETIFIIIYSLLIGFGLCANLLVCFVVARKSQMHTPRNLYIVNLSISDMTMCIVCMPFTLIVILRREWTLGTCLCKMVPVLQGANIMISIGTITTIALDRYFTIVRHNATVSNQSNVIVRIIFVWTFSILVSSPLAFYQVVEQLNFHNVMLYETCIEKWPSHNLRIAYTVCILLIQAIIPALVVGMVHIQIASYLHQHAKGQSNEIRAQKELERNRKTTFLLLGIAVLFLASWLPLTAFSLLADILYPPQEIPKVSLQKFYSMLATCHVIAMTSAITNPIVYGFLNANIRHEFQQLFSVRCSKKTPKQNGNGDEQTTTKTLLATSTQRKSGPITIQLKSDKLDKSTVSPTAQVESFML